MTLTTMQDNAARVAHDDLTQYEDVVRDEWRENARLEAEAEAEHEIDVGHDWSQELDARPHESADDLTQYEDVVRDEWRENARLEAEAEYELDATSIGEAFGAACTAPAPSVDVGPVVSTGGDDGGISIG